MFPIILHWGPLRLHTYGVLAAAGFLAAFGLAKRLARDRGFANDVIGDILGPLIIGGLLGARAFYVIFHSGEFSGAWVDALKFWQGGLMWQGGFLGGAIAFVHYVRRKKAPLWPTIDVLAPAVALGQAVGRIGCLFAGCCYGRPCHLPWAITFRNAESLAPLYQSLHPTQLYDAALNLLLATTLLILGRRRYGPPGSIGGVYLVGAGLARLLVEPFRADDRGAGLAFLSGTGVMALAIVALGIGVISYVRMKRPVS